MCPQSSHWWVLIISFIIFQPQLLKYSKNTSKFSILVSAADMKTLRTELFSSLPFCSVLSGKTQDIAFLQRQYTAL